jgi:hypothetical protein
LLWQGNVHSADGWQEVLEPVVERYVRQGIRLLFRADTALAKPEVYQFLEARSVGYAIRLPRNEPLERQIAPLKRPEAEAPSRPIVPIHDFTHQKIGMWHNSVKI